MKSKSLNITGTLDPIGAQKVAVPLREEAAPPHVPDLPYCFDPALMEVQVQYAGLRGYVRLDRVCGLVLRERARGNVPEEPLFLMLNGVRPSCWVPVRDWLRAQLPDGPEAVGCEDAVHEHEMLQDADDLLLGLPYVHLDYLCIDDYRKIAEKCEQAAAYVRTRLEQHAHWLEHGPETSSPFRHLWDPGYEAPVVELAVEIVQQ